MHKVIGYLMSQVDAPTCERAVKLLLEGVQTDVINLVDAHEKQLEQLTEELGKANEERAFFEAQFKQATGWVDPAENDY